MIVPYANQMTSAANVAFDPSKTPAGRALAWWRDHEDLIVVGLLIGGGLFFAASMFAAVKAAPVAVKLAATKYPLLAAV